MEAQELELVQVGIYVESFIIRFSGLANLHTDLLLWTME